MKRYLLLIRGEDKFAQLSPAEMEATIRRYSEWAQKLRAEGRLVEAEGLDSGGRVLDASSGSVVVTDGPFAEAKEIVGGFYLIHAASLDEAASIARECPALGYGGLVEVRPQMEY